MSEKNQDAAKTLVNVEQQYDQLQATWESAKQVHQDIGAQYQALQGKYQQEIGDELDTFSPKAIGFVDYSKDMLGKSLDQVTNRHELLDSYSAMSSNFEEQQQFNLIAQDLKDKRDLTAHRLAPQPIKVGGSLDNGLEVLTDNNGTIVQVTMVSSSLAERTHVTNIDYQDLKMVEISEGDKRTKLRRTDDELLVGHFSPKDESRERHDFSDMPELALALEQSKQNGRELRQQIAEFKNQNTDAIAAIQTQRMQKAQDKIAQLPEQLSPDKANDPTKPDPQAENMASNNSVPSTQEQENPFKNRDTSNAANAANPSETGGETTAPPENNSDQSFVSNLTNMLPKGEGAKTTGIVMAVLGALAAAIGIGQKMRSPGMGEAQGQSSHGGKWMMGGLIAALAGGALAYFRRDTSPKDAGADDALVASDIPQPNENVANLGNMASPTIAGSGPDSHAVASNSR